MSLAYLNPNYSQTTLYLWSGREDSVFRLAARCRAAGLISLRLSLTSVRFTLCFTRPSNRSNMSLAYLNPNYSQTYTYSYGRARGFGLSRFKPRAADSFRFAYRSRPFALRFASLRPFESPVQICHWHI